MAATDFYAPALGPDGDPCATCAAPLARDQRYCLQCGTRRGPARLDPVAMARGTWPLAAPPAPVAPPVRARSAPWALPSPRVAATAAMAVLAFGIVAGTIAGPRASDSLAAASAPGPVVLVGPPPSAPVAATPATPPPSAPEPAATTAPDTGTQPDASGTALSSPPASPAPSPPATTGGGSGTSTPTPPPSTPAPADAPPIKHAWVVALTGHSFDEIAADPSKMPYLTGTLQPKGLTLHNWAAASAGSLANLVVLTSGQRPTEDQKAGCATYADTTCVLPKTAQTLPGELAAAGKTWRGYVESSDVGSDPPNTCRHPELGQADPWTAPRPGDAYLTQRDPFVYFHAIVDTPDCGANIAGISRLAPDAQDAASAPNYALVVPDACHDGRDTPCADGAPAGLGAADAWLQQQLDPLLASKAYADDGLIVVTFDAGPDPRKPVGALLLSPHVRPGTTDDTFYSHTGLLRTLEDAFAVEHLGKSASPSVKPLASDLFSFTTGSR